MADIEIVQPIEGAARVSFDYGAASIALDAYSAMARKLDEQAVGRVGARDQVVVNWAGRFRGEFDEAWNLLQLRFTAGVEGAGYGPVAIYNAIAEANDMQRAFNRSTEFARTQVGPPNYPGGVN